MSYSIDVNILLYASDEGSPFHHQARSFLDDCANGAEVICLAWPTIMGYLRIATHTSIFTTPLSPEEAHQNIEHLLNLPHVRTLGEEEGFWDAYKISTQGLAVRGNLVPDSHLAALLHQNNVRILYTNDSDFRRFSFLDVRNPLTGPANPA